MQPLQLWTDAENAILREKCRLHYSAGQLRVFLPGKSRNAIIGRLKRMGLSTGNRQGDNSVTAKTKAKRTNRKVVVAPAVVPEPFVARPARDAQPRLLSFLELREGQCRYIVSESLAAYEVVYCGADAVGETSWCGPHYRLCHQPSRHG